METVNFEEFSKARKKFERREKLKEFAWKTSDFIRNNKEITAATITTTGMIVGKIIKNVIKNKDLKVKFCDEYDPRTGSHWLLRRPMSTKEKLELERRYRMGEAKGDILHSMKLLK